jgi:hypothetical protein
MQYKNLFLSSPIMSDNTAYEYYQADNNYPQLLKMA